MFKRSNGIASYGRIASFEADPIRQIVMLYDGAIKFLNAAAMDIESANFESKAYHTNRALDIVDYLQSIIDLEKGGEVGRSFDDLYTKVRLVILKASAAPDAAMMRTAAELLRPVRNAWEQNAENQRMNAPAAVSPQSARAIPA